MTTTTGIKLEPEIKERLQALGKLRDRSPHWLMKHAIALYIDKEERIERERQEDEERYQHYVRTGEHFTQKQMEDWIDNEIALLSSELGE